MSVIQCSRIVAMLAGDGGRSQHRCAYVDNEYSDDPRATARHRVERVEKYEVGFFDYFGLDYLFNEIFVGLEYHFETDQRAPFIIDCGSNIGMSILFFKTRYPDAEILGFEPSAQAFAQLQENVNRNLLRDVRVLPVVVSDTEGTIDFFVDPDAPGSLATSMIPARMAKEVQRVNVVKLSSYIDRPVDFLKLDVEGAETAVVRELHAAGKLEWIEQMAIEYHNHLRADDDSFSVLLRTLEDAGFGYRLRTGGPPSAAPTAFQDILVQAYRKTASPLTVRS